MNASHVCAAVVVFIATGCGFSTATTDSRDPARDETVSRLVSPVPVVVFEYDAVGHLARIISADAGIAFQTDALGRRTATVDQLGRVTREAYDQTDSLAGVTDPRGVDTTYDRGDFGTVDRISSADTGDTTQTFDEAGNLVGSVDARGVRTSLAYDALNRLTSERHHLDGVPDEVSTWTYDDGPDGGGSGLLTKTTFPGGVATFEADATGALVATSLQFDALTLTTRFAYEAHGGRLVEQTYPSGRRLGFELNGALLVGLVVKGVDGGDVPLVSALEFDQAGKLERWSWPLDAGPSPQRIEKDSFGRVTAYAVGGARRDLRYDEAGRVVAYVHPQAATLDQDFTYDAVGRLIGYTHRATSHAISYDDNGNRMQLDDTTWQIEPTSNRLVSSTVGGVVRPVVIDERGNLEAAGELTATSDLSGRLASMTRAGITVTATYDTFGRRVRKHTAGGDVFFVYDDRHRLLGEYGPTGTALREYVWVGETLVAFFRGDELFYVQSDHLGAPRAAYDTSGALRWSWLSDPFGVEPPNESPSSLPSLELPLRFPGQYADLETGLLYNHFRHYDPASGRYVEADPLGLAGGLNPYTYVDGQPVMATDPTGEVLVPVAVGYLRCVASCTAMSSAEQYLFSGFDASCIDLKDAAKECLADCLNPLNWFKKGRLDAKKSKTKPKAEPTSPGQLDNEVNRGIAPKGIKHVHGAHNPSEGGKPHVHYSDGTSSNIDGTIHDRLGGVPRPSNTIRDYLRRHLWTPPPKP